MAFWTTLVNACWPHVCDMTKYIWGLVSIYLKSLPQNIMPRNAKLIMRSKKSFFLPTRGWWNNYLHLRFYSLEKNNWWAGWVNLTMIANWNIKWFLFECSICWCHVSRHEIRRKNSVRIFSRSNWSRYRLLCLKSSSPSVLHI